MPLNHLRSVFFSKKKKNDKHSSFADSTALMMSQSAGCRPSTWSQNTWSSNHDDFRCLRFLVWNGGAPGFTLTTSRESEAASTSDEDAELVVDRITSLKVWEAGVRPGDVLETVSGKRVHTMDTEAAIVLVQMSKSPSIIRFRSPRFGKRVHFNIHLGRQKLGIYFSGDGRRDVPIVTRVSQSIQKLSDVSTSPRIRVGDVLVSVNGKDAVTLGLNVVTKYLETCPRPLTLTFERYKKDGSSDHCFYSQPASEEMDEHFRHLNSLRRAVPKLALPALTREVANLRSRQFFNALKSSVSHSAYPRLQQADDKPKTSGSSHEILITWIEGPLGLTLIEDDISGAVIVNRLTGKGSSVNLARLRHGYQLLSINGERLRRRTLDELHQDLVSLRKPVKLLFKSEKTNDEESSSQECSNPLSPNNLSDRDVGLNEGAHRELASTSVAECPRSQQIPSSHVENEYEVAWTTSQLGLELELPHSWTRGDSSTSCKYPIVRKILKKSTLDLPPDAIGHLLISVNNQKASRLSTKDFRMLLRLASRPAVLRFRRQDGVPGFKRTFLSNISTDRGEGMHANDTAFELVYTILWSKGKLGILFACYDDADHQNAVGVYVKHIGPGQAQSSKLVAVGDILISINGQNLPPKPTFKRTMRSLTNFKQPVTLGFRRLSVERSAK
ncbi:PDZ domain [Plasmopara halstedii]|uniref:PDZ domain n=1 Tax=Plasmopara halstedii TaxID=4781 RepID=A0A0P1A750_PLAHL|nr:PDZ domain [Plasmopara halstedii]CEG36085.1 PDZ domain [Plasmopara halstedii]|eukprot:XP_024572454.1 PDZ domain [Plasmopara halstedii]